MADEMVIHLDSKDARDALDATTARLNKAAMYALRQVGREVRKASRAKAPVYKGKDRVGVIKCELRASIKPSRNIKQADGTLTMFVGPFGGGSRTSKGGRIRAKYAGERGGRARAGAFKTRGNKARKDSLYGVALYRGAQEARFGYMRAGTDVAEGAATAIFADAFAKSLSK